MEYILGENTLVVRHLQLLFCKLFHMSRYGEKFQVINLPDSGFFGLIFNCSLDWGSDVLTATKTHKAVMHRLHGCK